LQAYFSIFISNNRHVCNKKTIIDSGDNNEEVLYII
jgi:hypothetical protein